MTRHQANAVLLLAGALWGMGFVAQSTAMEAIGPFTFIALRFLVATLAMLPFAVWEGRRATPVVARHQWRQFAVIGILLFAAIATQQVGLMTTSVTNSGFLTGLYVVMVPLLAVGLFREWPHRVVWPASLSALAGIFMLSGGNMERLTTGDWLTILCALFCALQMIFIARFVGDSGRPVTLAVTQFAVCAGLGFAVALPLEPFETGPILQALPEVLYAGIVSGGIAFTLQVIGQRYTTASQAALFLSTEAVFAALFGAILLGERLPPIGLAGCALIFAAILSVEIVPNRQRVSP
ncbi:MAG: DMT family transporter [Rhizobiaceae bacterium]|nr:DMT family transporter [Rhizobiaceae bacterium]MCV0408599.1 DMT family transporter [Rhizobiaceae bacterium]